MVGSEDDIPLPPPSQTLTQQTPHTVSTIKLPILKKGEYDIRAMKMEHYLAHTDYPIWEVIQRGNGPVSVSTDTNGLIKRSFAKFHKMTDAKEMWEAIKSRFGGNDESKKMQKVFESIEFHGAGVVTNDENQKFLRVFESDVKGSTASSSSTQNVAFISENTSSTNDVSTAYGVSNSFGHNSQYEHTSSYSLLANQSSCPQLDHEDLEQLDEFDLEEMDLKWQVAMISMRMKKFYKKTGRKLQFDAKEPVGFDKTKVECYSCHKTGHFARECRSKGNQDSRRRDTWNTRNKDKENRRRTGKQEDSKALVTLDGEGVDWTSHSEDEQENYALMACSSSGSDTKLSSSAHPAIPPPLHVCPIISQPNSHVQSAEPQMFFGLPLIRPHVPSLPGRNVSAFREKGKNCVSPQRDLKLETQKNYWKQVSKRLWWIKDYPQRALQNKGIVDSGCFRHMTGNKAYLAEYQDFNGGPVAFGGSKVYITGTGKIKTGKLDFKDVCFVKELHHFNLFSVSQMCDKKNKVLFTDSECLVLSPEFNLPDENQVLLRILRQNNMYSFNLENIVPFGGLACLIAKATIDESNKWHMRLGHVNFKNLNKLVKGNLVRGLPSKIFHNDHTCVACQKGKQHKASCKAKLVSSISQPLQLLHIDLCGPTSVRGLNHKTYCLVITDDFSRCDNGTEFKNRDFIELCGSKGIKREYSNDRTPQQNGVVKRKNRTIIEAARTMLADSFLPNTFWAEAKDLEALKIESWVDAMQEELLQFKFYERWFLVDLPYGKKAIGTKWVYRNKKDERGVVVRNKARIFLAFASYMGFIVYQMDVKSAFLYGKIDEEISDDFYGEESPSFLDYKIKQKGMWYLYIVQDKYVAENPEGNLIFASVRLLVTPWDPEDFSHGMRKDYIQSLKDLHLVLFKEFFRTFKRKNQHKKKVLKTSKRRSVFKQGRKIVKSSKGAPTVPTNTEWDDLDMDIDDTMDYTLAQDEGKTDKVDEKGESTAQQQSTDRQDEGTDMPKVSTARTKLSTDKFEEGTAEPEPRESTSSAAQTTPTPTPTTFGDDETIAQVLLNMSQAKAVSKEKEKGVEIRNAKNAERPRTTSTRSVLTLKPLPKIDPNDKGKKRIEEDEESEEITEAKKKFDQIAHDEEVARKIQEEWEAEEERKRLTEEEATKTALSNEYDFIQARIEADRLLAERVQEAEREQFTVEERAKFLHDTIATQRRILAQQRTEAIRNKPPTKNQFRNQMMTYLKHVGNKKHADLKTKSFDEIKALYEKVKRFDDSFITIGSTEDERKIKEMNEGASDPDKKKK
ncbi:putative ribonuclease H-like domain-containing protein, partial [Tanacetum coccineum]